MNRIKSFWKEGVKGEVNLFSKRFPPPFVCSLLIVGAIIVAFWGAHRHYFQSDDFRILEDPLLYGYDSVADVLREFTTPSWGLYYRPLIRLVFYGMARLFREEPQGYHLMSLVVHTLCSLTLFAFLSFLVGRKEPALFCSLFFAVDRLRAEPVLWIAGLNGLLASLFSLLTLLAYSRSQEKRLSFGLSLLFFSLALLTKESTLTLMALLFLYDLFYKREGLRAVAMRRWSPFVLLALCFLLIRWAVMSRAEVPPTINVFSLPLLINGLAHGLSTIFSPISLLLPRPASALSSLLLESFLALLALCLVPLLGLMMKERERKAMGFFLLWVILEITPLLLMGLFPSDRHLYLATVGSASVFGLMTFGLLERVRCKRPIRVVLMSLLIALSIVSLVERKRLFREASEICRQVLSETRRLYPYLPDGSLIIYLNLPDHLPVPGMAEGAFVFRFESLRSAIALLYRNPTLQALSVVTPDQIPLNSLTSKNKAIFTIKAKGGLVYMPEEFLFSEQWKRHRISLLHSNLLKKVHSLPSAHGDSPERSMFLLEFANGRLKDKTGTLLPKVLSSLYGV